MKFANAKDTFRFHAVTGFESDEQLEELMGNAIDELGVDGFEEFETEVLKEMRLGVFLSPPPQYVY